MSVLLAHDAAPLAWVRGGIEQELGLARQYLQQFAFNPADSAQLRLARGHLHQVTGAARMLELQGLARFCEEIEALCEALEARGEPSPPPLELLNRALDLAGQFVEGLLRGEANAPLRLYPVYGELAAARGAAAAPCDLFFPPLDVVPPPAEFREAGPGELALLLRGERTRFQRALLAWLRDKDPAGLADMAQAVATIEQLQARPPERAFWWATRAFFEALVQGGLAPDLPVKQLCGKIDLQIRRLAEGGGGAGEQLFREVLWQVARSRPVVERIAEVQAAFGLKALLPEPPGDAEAEAERARRQPLLAQLADALAAAKEAWIQCATGAIPQALPQFLRQAARLREAASGLGHRPLGKLASVVGGAASELQAHPERLDERLAVEMATALLVIESAAAHFSALPPEFPQQVEAVVERVRHAALGKWDASAMPPLPGLDQASRKAQERMLMAQLGHEIQTNLRQAEEVLDGFFRNASRRPDLAGLEASLGQVSGAFSMLGLERPLRLLRGCMTLVQRFATPDYHPPFAEMELLAEGLSALGFYAEQLRAGQGARAEEIIATLLERRPALAEAPAEAPAPEAAPAPAVAAPAPGAVPAVDPELLAIFLEESAAVLEAIRGSRERARANPQDLDALITIRRGFHTLKGSGRMVGLRELGEAAWSAEQVMNRWLEDRRPAEPAMLEFIEAAHGSFSDWIGTLRQTGHAAVDARELFAQAAALGAKPPAPEAPAAAPPPAVQEPAPAYAVPAGVEIAGTVIPTDLFEIFAAESRAHLETLSRELAALQEHPEAPARAEFMRAAHTLAGIARTVGLQFIAELAFALEQWLRACLQGTARPGGGDIELMDQAVTLLTRILGAVCEGRAPEAAERDASLALGQRLQFSLAAALETAAEQLPALAGSEQQAPAQEDAPSEALFMEQPGAAERGPERRAICDDIDPRLLPIFLEEAGELAPQVGAGLRAWRADPANGEVPQLLRRDLHTLKGSARMAGAMRLGELTHSMESRVEAALEAREAAPALFDDLEERFDRLLNAIELLQRRGEEAAAPAPAEAPAPQPVPIIPAMAPRPEAPPLPAAAGPRSAQLRVRADLVDHLVNQAGEVSIARSRVEAEMHALRGSLLELTENVMRLRSQLREIEIQAESQMQSRLSALQDRHEAFDPLEFDRFTRFQELTRMMAEGVNDVATVQQNLLKHVSDTEVALLQQARLSRELQQQLLRVRAVPFVSFAERFYRTVRQAARDLGRNARLTLSGAEVEIDRGVLEKVSAPIEHMLRNAVAHGIEPPEARLALGKPETGSLSLALKQEGNEVSITLADDGAGLDLPRIRARALELGILAPGRELSDAQAMQLIFAPGFSTAAELTEVSGRGVGMDVVRGEVTSLGGRVEVFSEPGKGTRFTLYLPLTLAVAQVVLVRAGPRSYALPSAMVEQVRQVKPEELKGLYEARRVEFRGNLYPFHYLPRLLGDNESVPEAKRFSPVLLLKSGLQRAAVHADDLSSNQEVVVKNIGPQLSRVAGIEGATVLGTGQVVLIINPVQLAARAELLEQAPAPAAAPERPAAAAPVVMVVDDSLTVRKITGRLLARDGYQVMTAKDGLDALQQVEETVPDVMLVDIEMPRMDGFDLTKHLRANPRTAAVPIIMITSRTAEKHRAYARELGVDVYLGKPYQEEELLQQVAAFVGQRRH
jgi:chemosensory pili system protein ChpA (sensor histidine kinase/response regulator)